MRVRGVAERLPPPPPPACPKAVTTDIERRQAQTSRVLMRRPRKQRFRIVRPFPRQSCQMIFSGRNQQFEQLGGLLVRPITFPPGSRNLAVISGASAPMGCTISPPLATISFRVAATLSTMT